MILTAYCACKICCGHTDGLTAWSTIPVEGRTIAAPKSIPFGTHVSLTIPHYFTNRVFIVEDRTRSGKGWDLYLRSHQRAKQFGRKQATYKIVR
jgi:peptidoglycan DL-endopeptidase CwlO